jgi:hypothetical protein
MGDGMKLFACAMALGLSTTISFACSSTQIANPEADASREAVRCMASVPVDCFPLIQMTKYPCTIR